jgi:Taurine catabolism dioxygenase TauD, TfdA family
MKRVLMIPLLLQFAITETTPFNTQSLPLEITKKNEDWIQISCSSEMSLQNIIIQLEKSSGQTWKEINVTKNDDLLANDHIILGSSPYRIDMVLVYMGDNQFMKVTQTSENLMDAELIQMNLGASNEYATQIVLRGDEIAKEEKIESETPVVSHPENKDSSEIVAPEKTNEKISYEISFIKDNFPIPIVTISDADASMEKLLNWTKANQEVLQNFVTITGGLVLRGVPIEQAQDFANTVQTMLDRQLIEYKGGEEQQKKVLHNVYLSTEGQPSFNVPLHHEFSATKNPLDYICFYCDTPSAPGTGQMTLGSTMVISTKVKNKPHIWEFFQGKNLQYISRHPPKGSIVSLLNPSHKTWADIFGTTNKEEVEAICQRKKLEYRWSGNWIEIVRTVPAIREADTIFDEPYWFNQIHVYHPEAKFQGKWTDYLLSHLLYLFPSTRQFDVKLENGEEIPAKMVEEISQIIEQFTYPLDIQKGDILILDNVRTLHGRTAYSGGRKVWVTMIQHSPSNK